MYDFADNTCIYCIFTLITLILSSSGTQYCLFAHLLLNAVDYGMMWSMSHGELWELCYYF